MNNAVFAACISLLIRTAVTGPMYEPGVNTEMQACKDNFFDAIRSATAQNCEFVSMNCNDKHDISSGTKLIRLSCGDTAKTPQAGLKALELSGGSCNNQAKNGWLNSLFVFFCPTNAVGPMQLASFLVKLDTFMNSAVREIDVIDFAGYLVELFQELKRSPLCLTDGIVKYGYSANPKILDNPAIAGLLDMDSSGIWCQRNVDSARRLHEKRVMEIAAGYLSKIKENMAAATIEQTFKDIYKQGTSRPFRQSTEAKDGLEKAVKKLLKKQSGTR